MTHVAIPSSDVPCRKPVNGKLCLRAVKLGRPCADCYVAVEIDRIRAAAVGLAALLRRDRPSDDHYESGEP